MKLTKLRIKNFRTYKNEVTIDFDNLTAFVGKNDAGKSTILEALDIFFNAGTGVIKLDKEDINKDRLKNGDDETVISACFSDLPEEVSLDATNKTSLISEFLLNQDNDLEIIKKYKSAGKEKVYIKANHPSHPKCSDLLSKKNVELKKIIEDEEISCENKSVNSIMRKSIWTFFEKDLQLVETEIDVTKGEDVKSIWTKLEGYLPIYSLFQSDRKNSDADDEVQDPLKSDVEQILSSDSVKKNLEAISSQVKSKLKEVADGTLKKLEKINSSLAKTLSPKIPERLDWKKVFGGISIVSNDEIPINKRGSGVKRLILLSFFQSEADKKKDDNCNRGIIYAIEEPETSQHFEHQQILINSLKRLAQNKNTQIIITTHSAAIVKSLGFDNIRLVCPNPETDGKEIKRIGQTILPTLSLNEVNYLAFGKATFEYHQELYAYLYGYLNASSQLDFNKKLINDYGVKTLKVWMKKGTEPQDATLPYYIRNKIDHPEAPNNSDFTFSELKQSIEIMKDICLGITPSSQEQ